MLDVVVFLAFVALVLGVSMYKSRKEGEAARIIFWRAAAWSGR